MQLISRQEAIEKNLNKYFTGEACVNGHFAERYITNGRCKECKSIQKKGQKARQKQERINKYGKNGQTKYFTGEACVNGHFAERYVANGYCVECVRNQQEIANRKAGILPRHERNKLQREATNKKKKEKQKTHEDSKLNSKEKAIVDYARKCLRVTSKKRRLTSQIPTNIAELENGYDSNTLNIHLSHYSRHWGNKKSKRKWHIDHIIPLSKLVKKGVTEVYILNSIDNLQLLSPSKNMKKGAKLVTTDEEVDYFIASKLNTKLKTQGYEKRLGFYSPNERINKLVNSEAERIYKVVTSSISGTEYSIKSSRATALEAIKYDMWAGYNFFSQKNSYDTYEIISEFAKENRSITGCNTEGLLYILFEEHIEKKKEKGFIRSFFS